MGLGTLGDTYVDRILGEYIPLNEANTPIEELLTDESDQLLYALLVEMRASRFARGQYDIQSVLDGAMNANSGDVDVDATYRTETVALDELATGDEWVRFDLDFVTDEIDLRFDAAINVALAKDLSSEDVVQYGTNDSPVVGIPASTSWIWLSAQQGTGGANVRLEAWSDN